MIKVFLKIKLWILTIVICGSFTAFSQTAVVDIDNQMGQISYESKDHRSNVYAVSSDRKNHNGIMFEGILISYSDYYPYGMMVGDRSKSEDYRFGFQGQEVDDESKGKGNLVNYKYRMHDSRVGRFFAVDPLAAEYSYNSSYAFSENRLFDAIELEGLEAFFIHGTNSNASRWYDGGWKKGAKQLARLTTNKRAYASFKWGNPYFGNWGNGLTNSKGDRSKAAAKLIPHVIANYKLGEDITLIGHSHGGNVAIQAIPYLRYLLDRMGLKDVKINLITIATPVDNKKGSVENIENAKDAIDTHIHIYNEKDIIQTDGADVFAGTDGTTFERKFKSEKTINVKIDLEGVDVSGIGAHSIDETHPEIIKKNIDNGTIPKIKEQ